MQLKFLAGPTGKYQSAYSPYTLNELKLARTQEVFAQHEKIYDAFFLSCIGYIERENHLTLLSL